MTARAAEDLLAGKSPDAAVLARVAALEAHAAEQDAVIARQGAEIAALRGGRLSRSDRRVLVRLLAGIAGAHGSAPLLAREILVDPALASVVPTRSPEALGWLFKRAAGVRIGRYVVSAIGIESNATVWQVSEVLDR